LAISKFSAAAELAAAPGAGSGALSISEAERRKILDEEQRQLDILKVFFVPFSTKFTKQNFLDISQPLKFQCHLKTCVCR